jgi:hypothetical protein
MERYDGPLFRVLRKHIREDKPNLPQVLVLSGEFGLISADTPLPSYDKVMTQHRAAELRSILPDVFRHEIGERSFTELFVSLSGSYMDAMQECWQYLPEGISISFAQGSIGGRASQLAHWLRSGNNVGESPNTVGIVGEATLLGATIRLTCEQVLRMANEARSIDPEGAVRFQTWFVELGNTCVAPKWLASLLFDKPVSKFRTADARRVLADLGLSVRHVSTLTI